MSDSHNFPPSSSPSVTNYHVIRFFAQQLLRYKRYYLVIVCVTIVISRADRSIPLLLQQMTDQLIQGTSWTTVQWIFVTLVCYRMTSLLGWRITDRLVSKSQSHMLATLYDQTRYKIQHHSQQFFVNTFGGKLTKNMSKLVRGFEDVTDIVVFNLMPMMIGIVIMIIYLRDQYQRFAGAILCWIIIYSIAQYFLYGRLQRYSRELDQYDSKFSGYVADTITNQSTIHNFAMIESEYETFQSKSSTLYQLFRRSWNKHSVVHGVNSVLIACLQLTILYMIIRGVIAGHYTIGFFVMMQTYLTRLFEQMFRIGQTMKRFFTILSESTDMLEMLQRPIEVADRPHAQTLHITQARIDITDLTFAYGGVDHLFDHFSLSIAGGQKIGIVGQSGGGKTTLIKLLMRSYDIHHGSIQIDGQDIAGVKQDSLRSQIALVSQEPLLFHRSLAENIRYARPQATMDEVVDAAHKAYCHNFISHLKYGYDTLVGERGVKLSGGERQRIAIARAILANRPILIMDEATSSLDTQSEHEIQQAMKYAMQGKTTIVVAHRLSTLLQMDRIIVLDGGRIIQDGHHHDLITQIDDLYAILWSHQKGGFVE